MVTELFPDARKRHKNGTIKIFEAIKQMNISIKDIICGKFNN